MENGLFSSEDLASWSRDYVLYLHISTRIEGREHEGLFRAKGFTGFPTLAFLDDEGGLIAKHAGARGTQARATKQSPGCVRDHAVHADAGRRADRRAARHADRQARQAG